MIVIPYCPPYSVTRSEKKWSSREGVPKSVAGVRPVYLLQTMKVNHPPPAACTLYYFHCKLLIPPLAAPTFDRQEQHLQIFRRDWCGSACPIQAFHVGVDTGHSRLLLPPA